MADFKIRKLEAQVVQNADYIHNQGPIGQLQVTPAVKAQLHNILTDIAALTESGVVSRHIGYELRDSVLVAAQEADSPLPRAHRLTTLLSWTKKIAVEITAMAVIAEGDNKKTNRRSR